MDSLCVIATHDPFIINICEKILFVDEKGMEEVEKDYVQKVMKQDNIK